MREWSVSERDQSAHLKVSTIGDSTIILVIKPCMNIFKLKLNIKRKWNLKLKEMVCFLSLFFILNNLRHYTYIFVTHTATGSNNKLYKIMLLIYYKFPLLPTDRFQTPRLGGLGMCHTPCLYNLGFISCWWYYKVEHIIWGSKEPLLFNPHYWS